MSALPDAPDAPVPPDAPEGLLVQRMRRRVRLLRGARGAVELSVNGLAWAVAVLLLAKLGLLPDPAARRLLMASAGFPLAGALAGWLAPISPLRAAQILDGAYALHDAIASALQFRALPSAARTPMMAAALQATEARLRANPLDPRRALGWRWPPEARVAMGLLATLGVTSLVEFRDQRIVAATARAAQPPGPRDPLALTDDDVQAFRDLAEGLRPQATSPESRRALEDFQRFLDAVARQRLDRQEAFRRLAGLQDAMAAGQGADREALRQALQQVGDRLGTQAEASRSLAEALHRGDLPAARDAAHALAERLRTNGGVSPPQRQELARALARASQPSQDREALQERLRRAREQVEQSLRQQRERPQSPQEESLLHRRQRDLAQTQRESDQAEQQRRQVEHLQRELAQAAQDLAHDPAQDPRQAAGDMDRGAEELSRMQDAQQGRQSMEELRQRLEELREQMRQQNGQNGQRQRTRLSRFSQAASGHGAVQQGGSQQGGSQQGGSQQGGAGSQGQPGSTGTASGMGQGMTPGGNGPGQGALAQGQGNGAGGVPLPMPGQGGGQGQGQGNGQGPGNGAEGTQPGGSGAGTGHDDNLRGAASTLQGQTHAVQVQGQASGGPSRSQVIRTAAADGFATAPYRAVYAPYWDHAREVLHEGEVPPGYRSYVRRYFQLIRPRE